MRDDYCCAGLGIHVDHLHPTVGRIHRRVRILRPGLAVAYGHEIRAVQAVMLDQVFLDGVGTAFREVLIISFAADCIGVAGEDEGRALHAGIRQRLAELLHRLGRALG